jgi:hypothetical protein
MPRNTITQAILRCANPENVVYQELIKQQKKEELKRENKDLLTTKYQKFSDTQKRSFYNARLKGESYVRIARKYGIKYANMRAIISKFSTRNNLPLKNNN